MNHPPRFFSPAETASRLKVSTKALRLYETLGLVKPVRTSTGWRTYGPEQMVRLHQVLALKHLGLPLKRVGEACWARSLPIWMPSCFCRRRPFALVWRTIRAVWSCWWPYGGGWPLAKPCRSTISSTSHERLS